MRRLTRLTNPDKCNLRCPLCFLNQRGRPFGMGEMPLEVAKAAIEKYAEEIAGGAPSGLPGKGQCGLREVIPSTMGEPLLYLKFKELLEFCGEKKIPLNLTTNGSFPGLWGTAAGMERLLLACSDIKVSCMGFDAPAFAEMMPGLSFDCWRSNVEKLLSLAGELRQRKACGQEHEKNSGQSRVATVSLQVTLHKKLLRSVPEILRWADSVGIARVKWNLPVLISAGESLRAEYGIAGSAVHEIRRELESLRALYPRVRCEGSLFFGADTAGAMPVRKIASGEGPCDFFKDEIWILPDGTEERCPNPERRFGDRTKKGAACENCMLLGR